MINQLVSTTDLIRRVHVSFNTRTTFKNVHPKNYVMLIKLQNTYTKLVNLNVSYHHCPSFEFSHDKHLHEQAKSVFVLVLLTVDIDEGQGHAIL